jgi:UDP-glucose 4-epimerase
MSAPYLVTGCAGFLGSNLVGRMLAAGHAVTGVDNLSMGLADNLAEHRDDRRFRFLQADVTDPAVLGALPGPFAAVVHLAAFKIPRYGKAIDTL